MTFSNAKTLNFLELHFVVFDDVLLHRVLLGGVEQVDLLGAAHARFLVKPLIVHGLCAFHTTVDGKMGRLGFVLGRGWWWWGGDSVEKFGFASCYIVLIAEEG